MEIGQTVVALWNGKFVILIMSVAILIFFATYLGPLYYLAKLVVAYLDDGSLFLLFSGIFLLFFSKSNHDEHTEYEKRHTNTSAGAWSRTRLSGKSCAGI
jgi:Ca2+/Na+ antiporter